MFTTPNGDHATNANGNGVALDASLLGSGAMEAGETCAPCDRPRIAIVLIEKRPLVRDYVTRALELMRCFSVVAHASVDEWVGGSKDTQASIVLLSAAGGMSDPATKSALTAVWALMPRPPVVVLSDVEDTGEIVDALAAGVRGWIPTSLSLDVAVHAIRLVNAGGTFVPARSLLTMEHNLDNSPQAPPLRDSIFTARQLAVIEALRRGKANKIIAYELNMRESTVKVHVRNIMKRLNARNRTEVAFRFHELLGSEVSRAASPPCACD
jgi:DNA-binding NarL/FixJ family response regulator